MIRRRMAGLLALCLAVPMAGFSADDTAKARDLAQEFNVSQSQIEDIHSTQGLSWNDIRTSLMISQHSGASLDEVVRLKKSGMSFDDIASRYNLKLSDIEKESREQSKKGGEFREAPSPRRMNRRAARLADEFNVSPNEVMRLHDRGMSWKDVRHALFISEQSGRPVNEIVGLKESGMKWDDIAARYNVNLKEESKHKKMKKTEGGTMREAPAPQQQQGAPSQSPAAPGQQEQQMPPAAPQQQPY